MTTEHVDWKEAYVIALKKIAELESRLSAQADVRAALESAQAALSDGGISGPMADDALNKIAICLHAQKADMRPIPDDQRATEDMTLARNVREATIEECASYLEQKADLLTNSLHCGDSSAIIAKAHQKSRQLYDAAVTINELALSDAKQPEGK